MDKSKNHLLGQDWRVAISAQKWLLASKRTRRSTLSVALSTMQQFSLTLLHTYYLSSEGPIPWAFSLQSFIQIKKTRISGCTNSYSAFPATSAARCLIISITAALRRESDCCCNLFKCSFKSLHKSEIYQSDAKQCTAECQEVERQETLTHLQRGTWHSDSLQARACSWRRYHTFLQRGQPPTTRFLHWMPWRKRPLTFRQLGYWQLEKRHWEACTRRSSIFLSCSIGTIVSKKENERQRHSKCIHRKWLWVKEKVINVNGSVYQSTKRLNRA